MTEIQMFKTSRECQSAGFEHSDFEFVSDFVLRPRMIAVQATGCAPIPKAFAEGKPRADKWENAQTYASGLRVPKAFADDLILRDIRASNGDAIAVTDDEMRRAADEIGSLEGLFVCPEGAAIWAAAKNFAAERRLDPTSRIVVFNTGTGFKYLS